MDERQHDPLVCGLDPQTDCPKCKPRTIHLRHLAHIEKQLLDAGIDMGDLAQLIWMRMDDWLEEKINRVAHDAVCRALRTLTFQWRVDDNPKR